ncbi:MAG: hypothetical protein CMM43_07510 [Rhodospirillaceae bacterium]|nr:hypothetical protein [Rhodospirillaceae bacterium]
MRHLYFFWTFIKQPPLGIVLVITAFMCALLGIEVDRDVIIFIKNNSQYFYTDIFRKITNAGDATFWLLLAAAGITFCAYIRSTQYLIAYHRQLKVYLLQLAFVTSAWLLSGVIHHIIKVVLGRYRPRYLFSENWYGVNPLNFNIAHNSFPSGHTQTIFAIAIGLTLLYPRLGIFLVPLAVLVGISRVVLIAHYPSDVLFGAYLGMATAILVKRHYFDKRNIF